MIMFVEGVVFLIRGLNDFVVVIMYVCMGVWEYGIVRDIVCLVVKNSRKKVVMMVDVVICVLIIWIFFS